MKLTKEKLLRLSDSYIAQRSRKDRSIVCAYLTGSLLRDYPFINGTTDVDIIMIHSEHLLSFLSPPLNSNNSLVRD